MIQHPIKFLHYEWLFDVDASSHTADFDSPDDSDWCAFPFPEEMGRIEYKQQVLALGCTITALKMEYTPAALGQIVTGTVVNVDFDEPTFQTTSLRKARFIYREQYPMSETTLQEGVDLFRLTDRYRTEIICDCSTSGTGVILTMRQSVIDSLIGEEITRQLLEKLQLSPPPSFMSQAIPLPVSNHLIHAMTPHLTGVSLKLHLQSQVLNYLAALVDDSCHKAQSVSMNSQAMQRTQALYEQLKVCNGKIPTLEELATQYGRSAKTLNDEFTQAYGQTINAFVTDYRLKLAHQALDHSSIPIKQLAGKLGYTHVSNFTIAFKNKFGYSPGVLRKRKLNKSPLL